jgi:hypothetical protein
MGKGLSQKFQLTSGKLTLTEGADKAKDNFGFFMSFIFLRRIYMTAFNPDIGWISQKPASMVLSLKILLLGNLQKKIVTYIPDIRIESMNTLFDRTNKEYAVFISYKYQNNPQVEELVTFV